MSVPKGGTNPRQQTPNTDPDLGPNPAPERSLVEVLGDTADDLRQLFTDFGTRPYRVFSVVTRWTGGESGRGKEQVVAETELLPTPLVDLRPVRAVLDSAGKQERGFIKMTEVSPRYTEDDVRELFFVQPLPKGHLGFVEVQMDKRDGAAPRRHRYTVRGIPWNDAENFQWIVKLSTQSQQRNRQGQLSKPEQHPPRFRGAD